MRVLLLFVLVGLGLSVAGPAAAAPPVCAERSTSTVCDADQDRITDVIEKQVCGTSTCATGREDRDHDGIPDWSEITACGSATCAKTGTDTDLDGIPDFAERFVCGTVACSGGREDVDGDKIGDWAEFVICGDNTCANGSEDYDNDGISDAKQLTACVVAYDVFGPAQWLRPPFSAIGTPHGVTIEVYNWWPLIVGAILALLGLIFLAFALWRQRQRDIDRAASDEASFDADSLESLLK